jgi:hypothetical protein
VPTRRCPICKAEALPAELELEALAVIYVVSHRDHVRLGVDACPGIDERGHGLTMRTLHDDGCCAEWASGHASTPARAEVFREIAARWGLAWPTARSEAADLEAEPEAEP